MTGDPPKIRKELSRLPKRLGSRMSPPKGSGNYRRSIYTRNEKLLIAMLCLIVCLIVFLMVWQ